MAREDKHVEPGATDRPERAKRQRKTPAGGVDWNMVPASKGNMFRAEVGEDRLMVERAGRRLGSFNGFVNGRKVGTWKGPEEAMDMTGRAYLRFIQQSKQAAELRELQPSMTWSSTIDILLQMLETSEDDKVKGTVREQLRRMAKAADLAVMQKGSREV